MDILKSLKKYFGFDSFRKGQDELVENILKGMTSWEFCRQAVANQFAINFQP